MKLDQILVTALATLVTLTSASTHAITAGEYSTNPRFSAIVKIRSDFGDEHGGQNCTATFLSPRHLLTSGHCLLLTEKRRRFEPIKIDFSTFPKMDLFWNPNTVVSPHVKFIPHPDSLANPKPTNEHDVGMIVFDRPVSKTWMKLAQKSPRAGDDILISGYGRDTKRDIWSTDFQNARVEVQAVDSFIKLKRGGAEIEEGDSGGPAMIETQEGLRIVGINSYKNLVKGSFGPSKDRLVRLDAGSPLHAWVLDQLKRN